MVTQVHPPFIIAILLLQVMATLQRMFEDENLYAAAATRPSHAQSYVNRDGDSLWGWG